jgi:hypothetical protein
LYEDYTSSVHTLPNRQNVSKISWAADTPFGTSIAFQVRAAGDEAGLADAKWLGPKGPDSWYTKSGSSIRGLAGKVVQYRARLTTPNGAGTPYLTAVSIAFN